MVMIPGLDVNGENRWFWIGSGKPLFANSSYWNDNEPDHTTNGGDCVYMGDGSRKIRMDNCNKQGKFICEKY